jgi:hypothetical protein
VTPLRIPPERTLPLYVGEKEIVKRHIAALRSGQFRQCFGRYVGDDNERCAAGISDALGLEDVMWNPAREALYEYEGRKYGLIGLNDIEQLSFAQIADIVEAKFFPQEQT